MKSSLALLACLAFALPAFGELRLTGILNAGGECKATLKDGDTGPESGWLGAGESFNGYKIVTIQPKEAQASVEKDSVLLVLKLQEVQTRKGAVPSSTGIGAFTTALGLSVGSTEELQEQLSKLWLGKTRDEMRPNLNRIIQRRGAMGATKSGNQSSMSLNNGEASLRISISYDAKDQVSSVKCSLRPVSEK